MFFQCYCSYVFKNSFWGVFFFRENLVDASTRQCTRLFLYKHIHIKNQSVLFHFLKKLGFILIMSCLIVQSCTVHSTRGVLLIFDPSFQFYLSPLSNYHNWRNYYSIYLKKASIGSFLYLLYCHILKIQRRILIWTEFK